MSSNFKKLRSFIVLTVVWPCMSQMFDTSGNKMIKTDDACTNPINIDKFQFFGKSQSTVLVCINGIITFQGGILPVTLIPIPIAWYPMIAPFWSDIDTSLGGDVYYRKASADDLITIKSAIGMSDFTPTWGLIVSWIDVVQRWYGGEENTFQAALSTDGTNSFVIFNYENITWTSSSTIVPQPVYAQVGFDAGNTRNYFTHEWSQSRHTSNLTTTSNVDIAGRYIYKVDGVQIMPAPFSLSLMCGNPPCNGRGTCGSDGCTCILSHGLQCEHLYEWCKQLNITCSNRGVCSNTDDNSGWKCSCNHPGYSGDQCETVLDCRLPRVTCEYDGECLQAGNDEPWKCVCPQGGYSGHFCENRRDWCSYEQIDCSGNGICSNNNENNGWECTCRHSGYSGRTCDVVTDWCTALSVDCGSRGTCSNTIDNDAYECSKDELTEQPTTGLVMGAPVAICMLSVDTTIYPVQEHRDKLDREAQIYMTALEVIALQNSKKVVQIAQMHICFRSAIVVSCKRVARAAQIHIWFLNAMVLTRDRKFARVVRLYFCTFMSKNEIVANKQRVSLSLTTC